MEANTKWYVKIGGSQVFGPVELETLVAWAEQARVLADHEVSSDRQHWQPAKTLPELKLDTIVQLPNGTSGGPFNRKAAEALIASGKIPANAKLICPTEKNPTDDESKEETLHQEEKVKEPEETPQKEEEAPEEVDETEDLSFVVESENPEEAAEEPVPELPLAEEPQSREEKMSEESATSQEFEELKAVAESLREKCDALKAQNEKLEAECTALKERSQTHEEELEDVKSQLTTARAEAEKFEAECNELKAEAEEQKAENEKLRAEAERRKTENDELKTSGKMLSAERDALAKQVASASGEFSAKIQKLEEEISELKARNATLAKNCMLPPEAVEKFEIDRKSVFDLMQDEAERIANSLEGEYKLLEQIKALIAEREEMMLNKRRDYLRLVGGGPAGMLRRYQAGLNP